MAKKVQDQGERILRNEAYLLCAAKTKDEAQQRYGGFLRSHQKLMIPLRHLQTYNLRSANPASEICPSVLKAIMEGFKKPPTRYNLPLIL